MDSSLIFRPGRVEPQSIPLGRYLPRLPGGNPTIEHGERLLWSHRRLPLIALVDLRSVEQAEEGHLPFLDPRSVDGASSG